MSATWKLFTVMSLAALFSSLQAAVPDLTATGEIAKVDRAQTYNLGPTGMRGWIYHSWSVTGDQDGTTAFAPYQILVTAVAPKTPAADILATDDVILGASAGGGAVPLFTSDARKSLGWAIGAAEGANGILKIKRWRAGVTSDVVITLPVLGAYSATAPYDCPKSVKIMTAAASSLQQKIAKQGWGKGDGSGAISALALLATGNAEYLPMVQAYARSLAPKDLDVKNRGISAWHCYNSIFLAEYFMLTKDAEVFHGLSEYVIYAATHTSMFGTAGHGFSGVAPPGGWKVGGPHGLISWYGPVNQAGLAAQLSIVLGKKAGVVSPEIDPAIARAANFFGYYVNRGSIPYGEHQPWWGEHGVAGRTYYDHCSNGKDALAAVMFACMGDKPVQTEYFTRMCVSTFKGEQYGHTGQGFSYLWTTLAANMGGPHAAAEYLKQLRWDRDLRRRCDGSFVYEGSEQWGPGRAKDYWDDSYVYWGNPTAYYLLHAAMPLKKLYITGKNPAPTSKLSPQAVASAIWAAEFTGRCGAYSKDQLVTALGDWDPIVRYNAATELSQRTADLPTLIPMLVTMAENPTNANQREAACTALGCMKAVSAIPALTRRLSDSDIWVRAKAAKALGQMGKAAAVSIPDMLKALVKNVSPTYPFEAGFNWSDPLQISNGYLAETLFGNLGEVTITADKTLLYPAIRTGIKHPSGMWRNILSGFVQDRLTLADVVTLTPDLFIGATVEGPCDRMFTPGPVGATMAALAKHGIEEGIDICHKNVGYWGQLGRSALETLPRYGEAARRALPTLYADLASWPSGENFPTLIKTIAAIEAASTTPTLLHALPVASPQILVTPLGVAKVVTLAGSSCRTDQVTYKMATQPAHGTLTGTPPNLTYTPAKNYQGLDRFTFTVTDSLATSSPGTVHLVVGAGGTGLKGAYFGKTDFTAPKTTRTDAAINYDWAATAPATTPGVGACSVRWTGQVLAPESGAYRFSTRANDGVRLWVNGALVIDQWNDRADKLWNDSAEIILIAGEKYNLKMEHYHKAGPASARLYWYMPSRRACVIIPQELLFPVSGVTLTAPANGSRFGLPATVTLTADATGMPGPVTKVAFYNGNVLIGSATKAPFTTTWENPPSGSYRLIAKATGGNGQVSASAAAEISVDADTVPIRSDLVCWFDAAVGICQDDDKQITMWKDRSGNGHHGVMAGGVRPALADNQLMTKPAVSFSGNNNAYVAGPFFIKEQYLVLRSPLPTWSAYGAFIGRAKGRASSYLVDMTGTTGFDEDQFPQAVSKNGTPIALNRAGRLGFSLGTITDYMVLKITVNDNDTKATNYLLSGVDHQWSCKFDLAEALCYSRALTATEEAAVGGYLAAKYGIKTAYPPLSHSPPVIPKSPR